jgi:predicted Zn-dependent protease
MSGSFSPRPVGLTAVVLLFGIGFAAVLTHPNRERVSFDAVIAIWSSIFRDVDRVGLMLTQIGPEQEVEIGQAIDREISRAFGSSETSVRTAYVSRVGQTLARYAQRQDIPYRFAVVDSPSVNAFALPGGRVYVTTGLLSFVKSEAELAAVLGHEISHIDLRHCVERLQYELAVRRVAGDDVAGIVGIGYRLVALGFSKDQEVEADVNGVLLAAKAEYDPREALALYRRLGEREAALRRDAQPAATMEGEIAGAVLTSLESYFTTHPPAAIRLPAIEQAIERNAAVWRGRKFYLGRRNLAEWQSRGENPTFDEWVEFVR